MDSKPIHQPSSQKNEMLIFVLRSTSDDRRGWLMDSNRIHYPSPAKKWNAHFCITFNFWWLAGLVIGLEPHPPSVSSQKKWNAHFWITFNFWWSAGLVDELESHLPPLSNQKNEVLIFGLCSTSDDWPGWSMDSNPICHLSPAKEWNAHFRITLNFWWLARLVDGLEPNLPPLSNQKNEMLVFVLCSTSDDRLGWPKDSKPICNLFPTKKWNAHFCITFNFWCLAGLVNGLEPHPPPLSSQKKWNAHFWITFNFWWSAGLVDELESHLAPLSNQKNEVLIFGLCSTSDDWPGWSMDSNPIRHPSPARKMKCSFLDYSQFLVISQAGQWTQTPSTTPLQPKKWNAHFWITFNFWWSARLVNGLKPHPPPLSSQKNEMLIFGLRSISGDQPGWSMDSNPIHYPSPAKKWNAYFWITFNFWWSARLVNGLEPHLPPFSNQKMKCLFLYYVQLLMIGRAGQWTRTPSATPLQPKNEMLIFGLRSTSDDRLGWPKDSKPICNLFPTKNEMLIFGLRYSSDDQLGWSMDSKPIHHPSTKKMKCLFLYYVQLLMIGGAGWWTRTASTTLLQPKNEMLIFVLHSTSDDWPGWSLDLNPIHLLSQAKKNEMLIFGLRLTSDDQPGWLMNLNPICHPSPTKKMKCSFLDYVQLLMIGRAGQWTQTPSATYLQPKNEMLIFGLHSTSDDR